MVCLGEYFISTIMPSALGSVVLQWIAVAKKIGLSTSRCRKIASEVRDCVFEMLGKYI